MITFFKSLVLALTISATISTCTLQSDLSNDTKNRLTFPNGLLDIEILPGSFATNDCGLNTLGAKVETYVCVAFPIASKNIVGKNWDAEYLSALDQNGWKFAGGEANAYYLEKIDTTECSHSLAMVGWPQGTQSQIDHYFDTGDHGEIENQIFVFMLDTAKKCGNERYAK